MYRLSYNIYGKKEFSPQKIATMKTEGQKLGINLRANGQSHQPLKRKPPKLRSKNKGGAPKGNRNAMKTGLYTSESIAFRRKVRAVIVYAKRAVAMANMESARKEMRAAELNHEAARLRAEEQVLARASAAR